jgi:integrase/recombinase XerD
MMRRSMGIRSWEAAQKIVREWEGNQDISFVSVKDALSRYISDCEGRHLRDESLRKYRRLARELEKEFGASPINGIGVDELSKYREGWKISAGTARAKIGLLRAFFSFCVSRGWIEKNPAQLLKHPRAVMKPTLPVSDKDFRKLLEATERFPVGGAYKQGTGQRIKAFLLVLRYTGLRIQDCIRLTRDKVQGDRLFIYTQKTNVPVWIPLPEFVLEELEAVGNGKYYFWSGEGTIRTALGNWERSLARLGKIAEVKYHPHQLRDSFAVGLLQSGVSLETVSVLLGNSIKVCERHYNPWVKSRQDNLAREIERAWKLSASR